MNRNFFSLITILLIAHAFVFSQQSVKQNDNKLLEHKSQHFSDPAQYYRTPGRSSHYNPSLDQYNLTNQFFEIPLTTHSAGYIKKQASYITLLGQDHLSAPAQSWVYYTAQVPDSATTLTVSIYGGSGDADLYVKYNSEPMQSDFDCNHNIKGNTESCIFTAPTPGTWYIGIHAFELYADLRIEISYETPLPLVSQ